jgi:two-component system chemotaxis sensor kinase CheA
VGDALIPVVDLAAILGLTQDTTLSERTDASVVLVDIGAEKLGLLVQSVLGRHEVVIKSLGPVLARTPCAAGATLIGDRVLLVVDLAEVALRAKGPLASKLRSEHPLKARERWRVLVAEDSDVIRESIRRELSAAGFEVTGAEDGLEALELAQRMPFDAICTDVMMPELNGYELTRRLRTLDRYKTVPIVMVTSKDTRIDTLRGYDAGADAYLTKPTDASQLIRTLDALLRQSTAQDASDTSSAARQTFGVEPETPERPEPPERSEPPERDV